MALTNKLSAIGDAIRAKTGGTELLTLDAMPTAIAGIKTGGGDLPKEALTITELQEPEIATEADYTQALAELGVK